MNDFGRGICHNKLMWAFIYLYIYSLHPSIDRSSRIHAQIIPRIPGTYGNICELIRLMSEHASDRPQRPLMSPQTSNYYHNSPSLAQLSHQTYSYAIDD